MGRVGQQSKSQVLPVNALREEAGSERNAGMGANDSHPRKVPEPVGGHGMSRLRGWIMRVGGLVNRRRKDREFDEEIETHIQLHINDNLRMGMRPEEARRQAMI